MRPIWTGAISFGLINIPVKVFSAVQESTLDLDMLDARDLAGIHFKRVNADTGKEVPFQNIVKGYLYNKKYVILEKSDFEAADAKKTKMIEILNFVDQSEIDPMYYEQPYYLEPDKYGVKAYGILRDALAQSGKAGIATFVMRNKEALTVLTAKGPAIVLNRIRFEEEIRDTKDLNLPAVSKAKTKSKELAVAMQLIDQQTEPFDIAKYKDTYTDKLLKIVREKAKYPNRKRKEPALKVSYKKTPEDDLMSMLKASLGGKKKAS